jgi:hypothetical protein
LPFNVAGRDVFRVRLAGHFLALRADADGGAIASVLPTRVDLLELRVIDVAEEGAINGGQVDRELVSRELDARSRASSD